MMKENSNTNKKTKTITKTFREHPPSQRVTLETSDQSDEETWPDQQKDKDKDNGVTYEGNIFHLYQHDIVITHRAPIAFYMLQ